MKAIFNGSEHSIFTVYTPSTCQKLKDALGIEKRVVTKDEILASPETFRDTEFIFSTWGMNTFTVEEIKKYLPSLKAVFYGAGSVQFFAHEFLEAGVRVFSAWGANAVPVAEYTVAQILLANKGFFLSCRRTVSPETRNLAQRYSQAMPGNYDCTVGIIGAGMIGKLVIKMLSRYNIAVKVYDPYLPDALAQEMGVEKVSLEEIFSTCQTISNHVANLPQTVGMYDYKLFSLMKEDATFINTGRGAQVVEADLIRALEEKPNACAVLDVTLPEPPVSGSKLYSLPNVFLTPHIAGSSGNEVARMGEYMLDQYRKFTNGEKCEYEVSKKMLETMA